MATVGVLYTTVRRWFGPRAGLVAGAVMALAPVAALMFRFDDPDALLTLMITLAAYAMTRAVESGRTRWVVLAGVFVGAGFLSKFMAAFMVLPALALAYLWAGPPGLGKRVWQLLAGGGALLLTAGWWVAVVLLTPAADRPFVGSSTDNNILNLILGYNGFGRLTGNETGRGGLLGLGGTGSGAGSGAGAAARGFGGAFGGSGGITRLFSAQYGGQVAWLIPAALIAIVVMLWASRRAGRTDRTRAAALLWGGWLLTAGLVLSFMSGISHTYYVVVLTPAIGALAGIGSAKLWEIRRTWFARVTLAVALLVTGGLGLGTARPEPRLAALAARGDHPRRRRRRLPAPGGCRAAGGSGARAGRGPHAAERGPGVAGPGRRPWRAPGLQHRHRRHRAQRGEPVGRSCRDVRLRRPRRIPRRWGRGRSGRRVPRPVPRRRSRCVRR